MIAFHALWIAADMESQHLGFLYQYDVQYFVVAEACLTLDQYLTHANVSFLDASFLNACLSAPGSQPQDSYET